MTDGPVGGRLSPEGALRTHGLSVLSKDAERCAYVGILVSFLAAYSVAGPLLPYVGVVRSIPQDYLFGFSQVRPAGLVIIAAALVLAWFLKSPLFASKAPRPVHSVASRVALSVVSGGAFYLFRTRFLNSDGAAFAFKFMTDIPVRGAHVTHDEMWELYLHSRFWLYTNRWLGWGVEYSYQILSCLAGAVFVFLLLTWCHELFPGRLIGAFGICVSGAYVQLFFGDVENYTLTATWVMGYFLASLLFLKRRWSVIPAAVLLAIALTFHLEAGFLIPSLLYLLVLGWKQGHRRSVALAGGSSLFVVAGTLFFFHTHGLPIRNLWFHSHAFGHGGDIVGMLVQPSWDYYLQIANLGFLLIPAWLLILPLWAYRRIPLDPLNKHLLLSAGFMTAFVLSWRAQLGVYNDWNLFAITALPISLLVCRNVLHVDSLKADPWPITALTGVFFVHSYSWILANHIG